MLFCKPCYIPFRMYQDGIMQMLTSYVHRAALLSWDNSSTPYEFAASQLTYFVNATPAQTSAAMAADRAADQAPHAFNPAILIAQSPPISFGVRVTLQASLVFFVYTYAPDDLDSMPTFRTAIADAYIASAPVGQLDWEALCARRWVVSAAGTGLPDMLRRIRSEEDVEEVERGGSSPGRGGTGLLRSGRVSE